MTTRAGSYRPHFTLWAALQDRAELRTVDGSGPVAQTIRCLVALGDCGPIGQVRSFQSLNKRWAGGGI